MVDEALTHGPQTVTRHKREVLVIEPLKNIAALNSPSKAGLRDCKCCANTRSSWT